MTTPASPFETLPQAASLTASADRLASIAFNAVGIYTEGGSVPYTGPANAGGASGISIGVMQNDFGQNNTGTLAYAQAIADWHTGNGKTLGVSAQQLATGLDGAALTQPMRDGIAAFGATPQGADWIHNNFDLNHVNRSVSAAQQAFATPYGQAVLKEGKHVEEFAAFAMKVYNQ